MSLFDLATRAVRILPAETAHRFTIDALKTGLAKPTPGLEDPRLAVRLRKSGLLLPNPIGLAAGFDKNAATFGNGTMVALQMPSKEKVHEVYDAAIKAGGKCEGPAGPRGDTFYAGYFRDLDGNKLCAFHAPGM